MKTGYLKKVISKLPAKPGIYFFRDAGNKNIYIGKASSLRSRVLSYTLALSPPNGKTKDQRIIRMVEMAKSLKFVTTDSDIEALILESQYIKKYRPMFNIMMRDDKQYGFISFTNNKYPRIYITHQPRKIASGKRGTSHQNHYIGPFTDVGALKTTLRYLRKIFPYCTCKQLHNNYCLNYHIDKCPGFCCLKQQNQNIKLKAQNEKTYKKNVNAIKDILNGKNNSLIKRLEKEMTTQAKKENFEEATKIRLQLERVQKIFENIRIIQNLKNMNSVLAELKDMLNLNKLPLRIEAYDVSHIQGTNATGAMVVFTNGKPDKNEYRKFKINTVSRANDTAMLKEILTRRLNHTEWPYPDLIIVDGGKQQLRTLISILKSQTSNESPTSISVIALTKDKHHVGTKINLPNGEIILSAIPTAVKNLILHIDTEAHRFAIRYYRKLHRNTVAFQVK